MTATIQIPQFDFSSFYYAQLLEALIAFKRVNVPEHTDESPQDPLIQALRAFALVGHLNNVNVDTVANESTLPTSRLPETIRNMLRLIDYELASASPSSADVLFKLVQPLSITSLVVPLNSQVATRRTLTETAIIFEVLEALTCPSSDLGSIGRVLALDASVGERGEFTDYTDEANDGDDFTPWAAPAVGDCLYIGHEEILWDKLGIEVTTPGDGFSGVFEFYDGEFIDGKPDSKLVDGVSLVLGINGILGATNRQGAHVRVQLDSSGVWAEVISKWGVPGGGGGTSVNYIETKSLLGQSFAEATTSTVQDYSVGCVWKEIILGLEDETEDMTDSGDVSFALPDTLTTAWIKGDVNGDTMYWIRYRIVSAPVPGSVIAPVLAQLRIDEGNQFTKATAVQGQRQSDLNLGIADGVTPSQTFATSRDGFIDESEAVTVDSVAWTRVDNFLQSRSTDRHYQMVLGANDRATIVFGKGTNGAIPSGQVAAIYRCGIEVNGNVGANSIVSDKTGLALVTALYNPRPAVGWKESESASAESLELAKILGPASLRALEVALGPTDVETLTLSFTDPETNTRPFIRAHAIEESFGPKTIEDVIVAAGGGAASAEMLSALNTYFNGDPTASPPVRERIVANQQVTATNYIQKVINVSATVYGSNNLEAVEDAVRSLLRPEARKADGVSFEWDFGGSLFLSRIYHEIHSMDSAIFRIDNLLVNGGTANVELGPRELPVAGTITLVTGV